MSNLILAVQSRDQSVNATLSWSGQVPNGVVDYIILYYAQGSSQIQSKSTQSLTTTINGLVNGTTYSFYAIAYLNNYANGQRLSESAVVQTIPATIPTAPSNLQAVVSTNGNVLSQTVQLSWNASSSNINYPISNYKIYKSLDNVTYTYLTQVNALNYNVTGLDNGVNVYFKVSAVSAIGESNKSSAIQAYPSGLASAPLSLTVSYDENASNAQAQSGYQSVDLSWQPPASNGGNDITGYVLQYSLDHTFATGVTTVNNPSTSIDDLQDVNLLVPFADMRTSTAWYLFRVCAVTSLGNGDFSSLATIVPSVSPSQVLNLAGSNLNENNQHEGNCVTLAWDYQIDNSVPLLGYLISYFESDGTPESIYIYQPNQSPKYTIRQLDNGHEYVFNVMAFNMLGIGDSSSVAVTPSTIPSAPILSVQGHTSDSIDIQWDAPDDQGDTILGYKIFRCENNINFVEIDDIQDNEYSDEGLELGIMYYYKVCAYNNNGNGTMSNVVNEYPSHVPNSPDPLNVVNVNALGNGQQVRITWSQDRNDVNENGGSVITEYILMKQVGGGGPFPDYQTISAHSSSDYEFVDTGLINGQNYRYAIKAVNRDGQSGSRLANNFVPSGLPDAPQQLDIVQNNSEHLFIQFTPVNVAQNGANVFASNEGSAITAYKLYRDSVLIATLDADTHIYGDTNLINGQEYIYSMKSQNANGLSSMGPSFIGVPATSPDAIDSLVAEHGNQSVSLSWNPLNVASGGTNVSPSDQGSAVSMYHIYQMIDGQMVEIATTQSLSYTVSGLTNGLEEQFEVSAQNNIGIGPGSNRVACIPSTSPAVPRSVTLYTYDTGVEISWEDPLQVSGYPSGGLAFTYSLEISDQNGGVAYSASNITTKLVDVPNLLTNSNYILTIYADNQVDTNYHMYSASFQISANPIAVANLQKTSQNAQQINLQFSYQTAVYDINEFVLSVYDDNLNQAGYAWIDASSQSIIAGNNYSYNFAINSATVHIPNMLLSHRLIVSLFAINSNGKSSPVSNVLVINP
jgi:hypothetical protein